jgi:hypothetical protein
LNFKLLQKLKMNELFNFDPQKTLFAQLGFRLSLLAPIIISLCLMISLVVTENLCLNWSVEGFANFLTIFALPIGVAGLSIPLVAVCASQHRSVQSAAQIEATQIQIKAANSQNLLTNYYKHLEEFKKYIEDEIEKEEIGIKYSYRKLHKVVFTDIKSGDDKPSSSFLSNLASQLTIISEHLAKAEKLNNFERLFVTSDWKAVILSLGNFFEAYGLTIDLEAWPEDSDFDRKPSALLISEVRAGYRALNKLLHHCFEFSQVSATEYTRLLDPAIGDLEQFATLTRIHLECVSLSARLANASIYMDIYGKLHSKPPHRKPPQAHAKIIDKLKNALPKAGQVNTMLTHHNRVDNDVLNALLDDVHVNIR